VSGPGLAPVSVVETDDGPAVITPELRLQFRRLEDRWTHALLVGPCERPAPAGRRTPLYGPAGRLTVGHLELPAPGLGRWLPLAEAVEWHEAHDDPAHVLGPVYQDVQVLTDPGGRAARALAVGQAGRHHFAAAIHVRRSWTGPNHADRVHAQTRVEFDVSVRSRAEVRSLEARYDVRYPPARYLVETSSAEQPRRPGEWVSYFQWETYAARDYDALIEIVEEGEGASRLADVTARPDGDPERLRVAAQALDPGGTHRLRYAWARTRVMPRSQADDFPGA
jgi:hypothetical protein